MIFQVYMKDPDSLHDGIEEALDEELKASGLDEDEQEALREIRMDKAHDVASEWFEYGEYVTVEIDTTKQTARVVPVNEKNTTD